MQKLKRVLKNYNIYLSGLFVGISLLAIIIAIETSTNISFEVGWYRLVFQSFSTITLVFIVLYLLVCPKNLLNVILLIASLIFVVLAAISIYLNSNGLLPNSNNSKCSNAGQYYGYCDESRMIMPSCDGVGIKCAIDEKPVIYLYPHQTQDIKVNLGYKGRLISTYPTIDKDKSWQVVARTDGTLTNKADGKEYSYLFWEGQSYEADYDMSEGFVVEGVKTKDFLQTTLAKMGMTPKEYNEMIVYWLPKMEHNKYNLIHFAGEEYTKTAPLKISPVPDSMLRVFMVYKPLENPVKVQSQNITSFERKGFAVVEWGGTELVD